MDDSQTTPARDPVQETPSPNFDDPRALKRASLPPRTENLGARHAKRLTLNFPINLPPTPALVQSEQGSASPRLLTPATQQSSTFPSPSTTPLPSDSSSDEYGFLTALAAQERKVLELREELQRAEADLTTLKRQWALTEKGRKRAEIHHRAELLKPIRIPQQDGGDGASLDAAVPPQARIGGELARSNSMKSAASNPGIGISANGRRVFQSSRHTRTLSLLSPEAGATFKTPFPQPRDASMSDTGSERGSERPSRHPRSATLPSENREDTGVTALRLESRDEVSWRRSLPPPSQESLVRTGKQMASDLREGLWTFLEDIRQATVGEEGISATESRTMQPPSRRVSAQGTSRSRERLGVAGSRSGSSASRDRTGTQSGKITPADIDVSFWSEFGVDTPGQTIAVSKPADNTHHEQKDPRDSNSLDVDDDNWDMWDTPQPVKRHTPSSSRSTVPSKREQSPSPSPSACGSSPRTSTSSRGNVATQVELVPNASKSDAIPWPALTKLNPSNLTKTASNLMAEWERSLTPPAERTRFPDNVGASQRED